MGTIDEERGAYGRRLRAAMDAERVDEKTLAKALSISVQAVRFVLSGDTHAFTAANNARAAVACRASSHWLATGEGAMRAEQKERSDMSMSSRERDLIVWVRVLSEEEREQVYRTVSDMVRERLKSLTRISEAEDQGPDASRPGASKRIQ